MSERKVLNKYYPPDFDPAKIPRRKLAKDRQQVVRLMAPFSMQCKSCTEFIYKGKKFNARKEAAAGEHYFGIKIFRFYIKCPRCSNEITFKTDPKNSDYVAEHGAQRNFEPWREEEAKKKAGSDSEEEDDVERLMEKERAELEEEEQDSMRNLERNQIESKREMEILDKLQEIRTRNARLERSINSRGPDGLLTSVSSRIQTDLSDMMDLEAQERRLKELEEDEAEVARYFSKQSAQTNLTSITSIKEDDDNELIASGSGTRPEDNLEKSSAYDQAEVEGDQPKEKTITIKRKFTESAEPEVKSLLSESAREMLPSGGFIKPVLKKKKNLSANLLGIKILKKS
ncbi:CWC16 protein [Phakopsora pachyrhizi]|uniref:Splicing factor YJU2 n=1 Tax=Phakopsora pachyrhizi TaxID=170000 RepID=A0AAV0BC83_PHAPC|nr:CWC16 protein [Phakopsora pachyrhizi]CAH7683477.1 CWC16 protein [Phakopsora pachyrhizi]CAH7683880.1 CWC16 protein [Phakopsora pachyrhizi]